MTARFWRFTAAPKPPPSPDRQDDDEEEKESSATLAIYGPIVADRDRIWLEDGIGASPAAFREELAALGEIDTLNVFINSEGGDVFAGSAIFTLLTRSRARIIAYIDGLAASAASLIAMAADTVRMPTNALLMVHNPWTVVMGDSRDLYAAGDRLNIVRQGMVAAYASKTGLPEQRLIALLDAETWLTAEEAVALGFADEIEQRQVAASVAGDRVTINGQTLDLSSFRRRDRVAALYTPADMATAASPQTRVERPHASDDQQRQAYLEAMRSIAMAQTG